MRVIYEKGNIRKTQYAQNDNDVWYCRTVGGKNLAARWGRCRENWSPDLTGFTQVELSVRLPRGE